MSPNALTKEEQSYPHVDRLTTLDRLFEIGIPAFVLAEAFETTETTVKKWHLDHNEPRSIRPRRALDHVGLAFQLLELRGIKPEEVSESIDNGIQNALVEVGQQPRATKKVTLSPIANEDGLEILMVAIDKEIPK